MYSNFVDSWDPVLPTSDACVTTVKMKQDPLPDRPGRGSPAVCLLRWGCAFGNRVRLGSCRFRHVRDHRSLGALGRCHEPHTGGAIIHAAAAGPREVGDHPGEIVAVVVGGPTELSPDLAAPGDGGIACRIPRWPYTAANVNA